MSPFLCTWLTWYYISWIKWCQVPILVFIHVLHHYTRCLIHYGLWVGIDIGVFGLFWLFVRYISLFYWYDGDHSGITYYNALCKLFQLWISLTIGHILPYLTLFQTFSSFGFHWAGSIRYLYLCDRHYWHIPLHNCTDAIKPAHAMQRMGRDRYPHQCYTQAVGRYWSQKLEL